MTVATLRRLEPEELGTEVAGAPPGGERLADRRALVLVGLTGVGKTTTVEHLVRRTELAAILPDRRVMTDRLILPLMTGDPARSVTDRLERFRLTAAFKERHPGGMGDVLGWLVLPRGLLPGPILFDGLRGAAEVSAAAAVLPRAFFAVLDCPPEFRLWRLCGRNDPFDRAGSVPVAAGRHGAAAEGIRSVLLEQGFDTLISSDALERTVTALIGGGVEAAVVARSAAIIVEEARHYDPAAAREALARLAPERSLTLDTATMQPESVVAAIAKAVR